MTEAKLFEMAMADWDSIDLLDRRDPVSRDAVRQAWYAKWSNTFTRSSSGLSAGMNRLLLAISHASENGAPVMQLRRAA